MNKKTAWILTIIIVLAVVFILILMRNQKNNSLSNPGGLDNLPTVTQIQPSKTLKVYADPSGFAFNYPDNLSLIKNEAGPNTYADINLTAKGIEGNLAIKISDTKFASLEDWLGANKNDSIKSKEAKLANLTALEVELKNRLILVALDHGVLFTIEIPSTQNRDFWGKAYDKVVADFSFTPQANLDQTAKNNPVSNDVSFEGEEVVE